MYPTINRILFASDLSETSRHAFQYALVIASRFCASLNFLYVVEDVPMSAKAFLDDELVQKIRKQSADNAQSQLIGKRNDINMIETELNRFCECAFEESRQNGRAFLDGEVRVVEGNVIDSIISVSNELECQAIVLGSTRRGAISEAMRGSVVKGVLRQSDKLVIVAPPK